VVKIKITAIILAAGSSKRMGMEKNKVLLDLKEPILVHSIRPFEENSMVNDIIIVANKDDICECSKLVKKYKIKKVNNINPGGSTRQESSYNGVVKAESDYVILHDAARPLITKSTVTNIIRDMLVYGAAVTAVPSKDTIKLVDAGFAERTMEREKLWLTQTPQAFKTEVIKQAHKKARADNFSATDDASMIERLGYRVRITQGSYENIKITTPDDIIIAKSLLEKGDFDD